MNNYSGILEQKCRKRNFGQLTFLVLLCLNLLINSMFKSATPTKHFEVLYFAVLYCLNLSINLLAPWAEGGGGACNHAPLICCPTTAQKSKAYPVHLRLGQEDYILCFRHRMHFFATLNFLPSFSQ